MIHYDTRKIKPSDTFIAIDKGANHIDQELLNKTSRIIKLSKTEVFTYLSRYWKLDMSKIKIIGVTGTNGKTTVTYLVKQILESCGKKCQIIGTITNSLTTPELFDILKLIKEMIEREEEYLVMEVSSIGVEEKRIYGLPFKVKCLTNITRDHLDYHKTFKNYISSKFKFLQLPGATIYPRDYKKIKIDFPLSLQGKFNVYNSQAAYAICKELGLPEEKIRQALSTSQPPKGRFQPASKQLPFQVFVDFAHTPDGLDNILKTARSLTKKRLITVFGAGGNRDNTKRPLMGKAACQYSDFVIVTSDNPRHEKPADIIKDILGGITTSNYKVIEDREQAIKEAVFMAQVDDIVVVAGKGHEDYQIIGDTKHHFDDFEVIGKYLKQRFPDVLH